MEWKEFTESEKEYPEKVVENAIKGFSKATNELVEMQLVTMNDFAVLTSKLKCNFQFILYLSSQFVPNYKLKLLTFGYDIELVPISAIIEESIHKEIFNKDPEYNSFYSFKDNKEFEYLLEKIFKSKRFSEIVSGLMKIARKKAEEF